MKITIYELLGMIKDGTAPKKIKVTGTIYDFDEEYSFYFSKTKNGRVALGGKLDEINLIYNFNNENEVEIIDDEEWKKIEEYPNYEISSKGNIRTKEYYDAKNHKRKSKILNKQINNVGYEYVILSNDVDKHKTLTVHRLMAKTFLNDYDDELQVNHINGIKTDNRIENLEMVTASENIKKRYEIGNDGNNYKTINQFDLDGNYIATYKSSYEAERITGICRTHIGGCCRNEVHTAGGYIWKFAKEPQEHKIPEKLNLDTDKLRGKETPRTIDYLIEDKINEILDYLEEIE